MGHSEHSSHGSGSHSRRRSEHGHRSGRADRAVRAGRGRASGEGSSKGTRRRPRRIGCLQIILAFVLLLVFVFVYQEGCVNRVKLALNWGTGDVKVNSPVTLPSEMPPVPEASK